ncbi:MAG: carboxypeptidase regulatory-like domain-containing protein [Verrucomicrobia bacterium]|nr:carboxypeptidase regulatory-like domain-containing protein [Verrucomicrobiota bacterium]
MTQGVLSRKAWTAGLTGALAFGLAASSQAQPTTLYSFGNPTANEQFMLELVNRARMNPANEGNYLAGLAQTDADVAAAVTFYTDGRAIPPQNWVSPIVLKATFASYAAIPPVAWNPLLLACAQAQAADMAARNYQGHIFPPTEDPATNQEAIRHRIEDVNHYDWASFGFTENVFASRDLNGSYARVTGVVFGHAGLMYDWGVPTLFHRNAIMGLSPYIVFKDVGIGVVETPRSTPSAPAYAIAQDFGLARSRPSGDSPTAPQLVGVVYADANQDYFYAVGEGRAGVTVTPEFGKYYTVTNASGGYSLPLVNLPPGTNSLRVTFSGGGLRENVVRDVPLSGNDNRKLDLRVPVDGLSWLRNLSTRLRVGTGVEVGIAGFVVSGDRPKRVLVRALGPTLGAFGISSPLADPKLELRNSAGAQIASNDSWTSNQRAEIQAANLAPGNEVEPALIITLNPGSYTAVVSGAETAPIGVAIVELYDLDSGPTDARAINVSTRGKVQTGVEVMIGGFVIGGTQPRKVVVRSLGPTLAAFGVTGALSDPVLELYREGQLVRMNDNWRDDASAGELTAKSLAPPDDREPALLISLNPGSYTAVVKGVNNSSGVGIVEVYDVP